MKELWEVPEELEGIWERMVWYEPERSTGARDWKEFLQVAMAYARAEELEQIRKHFEQEEFQEALRQAPAGLFDRQSWGYWHKVLGMGEAPAMPRRPFVPEDLEQDDRFSKCIARPS